MNRRGFFSRVLTVLAVGPLAKYIAPQADIIEGLDALAASGEGVMMVSPSTFKFWRNQVADGSCVRPLTAEDLRKVWNACE